MKSSIKSKAEVLNSIDPNNAYLPEFIHKAVSRDVFSIYTNTNDKHDYKIMVDRCVHFNAEQNKLLLKLLKNTKNYFQAS